MRRSMVELIKWYVYSTFGKPVTQSSISRVFAKNALELCDKILGKVIQRDVSLLVPICFTVCRAGAVPEGG